LQNDAVAVVILERHAMKFPVWIGRKYIEEARNSHGVACDLPFVDAWQVENHEILMCWTGRNRVVPTVGEFEVVLHSFFAEHESVETFMILEFSKYAQTQSRTVHQSDAIKIANRSRNAKMSQI
jgi:hypothetical protein